MFCDVFFFFFPIQDKCDMRPQTAHPLNNLTKASVKKPLSFANDTFGQISPDIPRRIKHQGNVWNVLRIVLIRREQINNKETLIGFQCGFHKCKHHSAETAFLRVTFKWLLLIGCAQTCYYSELIARLRIPKR